jgi:hypothetical protein
MAKSFDKMTKDELLEYKKEVEKKLKEKEQEELLVANQAKQIGFTALMSYAKNNANFAKDMVKALDQKLGASEKKRLQNVIDELNSFIPAEPVKDEKQQKENPVVEQKQQEKPVVVQGEQQKENPVAPVAPVQQQNNSVAVGVQREQQQTSLFNNAMTNV